eukprot:1141341-Pelagomonas_calceolata.AAC.2
MTFMICGGVAVFLAIILYQSDACPCPGRDGYDDHDGLGRKMAVKAGAQVNKLTLELACESLAPQQLLITATFYNNLSARKKAGWEETCFSLLRAVTEREGKERVAAVPVERAARQKQKSA